MANVGTIDRLIRIVIALALFSLYFVAAGTLRWFALLGFVPLITASAGFCPLYQLFGANTCNRS